MKQVITADPSRPIRRVYDEVANEISSDDTDYSGGSPDFDELRSSLSRHKRDLFPAIPRTLSDVIMSMAGNLEW
jgi:hypothetical protein